MPGRSLVNAQFYGKCPRCREGDIFQYPLNKVTKFSSMNKQCSHCDASFEPEPGFYIGAMFVSYALTLALFVFIWLVLYLSLNPSDTVYITAISVGTVLCAPLSFRYSRIF